MSSVLSSFSCSLLVVIQSFSRRRRQLLLVGRSACQQTAGGALKQNRTPPSPRGLVPHQPWTPQLKTSGRREVGRADSLLPHWTCPTLLLG
ncbi:hypothetical protein ACOMHN_028355 [Nucella lapillus]